MTYFLGVVYGYEYFIGTFLTIYQTRIICNGLKNTNAKHQFVVPSLHVFFACTIFAVIHFFLVQGLDPFWADIIIELLVFSFFIIYVKRTSISVNKYIKSLEENQENGEKKQKIDNHRADTNDKGIITIMFSIFF